MFNHDFERLVAAWLDGRIDAEESQALQMELQNSASARAKFRKYVQIDVALHEFADTSGMLTRPLPLETTASASPGNTQIVTTPGQSAAVLRPTGNKLSDTGPALFASLTSWHAALAVGLLLAFSLFSYFHNNEQGAGSAPSLASAEPLDAAEAVKSASLRKPPAPVATLASAERALWEGSALEIGQALYEQETIHLQEGKARISVGFGAEIVTEAPCSLTFLASDRIQLNHGKVAVDVAPWAKGFTVVTEEMNVVDLGTTFTVSASPGVHSETTVLKGVVRVHPVNIQHAKPRGLLVTEGQQVSVDESGLLKNLKPQQTGQLLRGLDFGVAEPYRPVKLNNTGIGLAVGDEDQHWRVVHGPEGNFSGPQYATVCVPHERYLPNDPKASQWISIADWETADANSVYTFEAAFDLNGYDLSTMQLFGRFLADNGIAAVRVNGRSVQVQSWVDNVHLQPFGDPQFRFVNVTEGLVSGRNVIQVDVRNGMQRVWDGKAITLSAIPNPMALRVEWYAFGRQHRLTKADHNTDLFRQLPKNNPPAFTLSSRHEPGF